MSTIYGQEQRDRRATSYVVLKNPRSGEVKSQKTGWSWTCFFFSTFLGVPLFLRGLYVWGWLMVVIFLIDLFSYQQLGLGVGIIEIGFSIFFGIKANEMAGKQYLDNGWEFATPDAAELGRAAWGLTPKK
jgi:hypothetical protein